MYLWLHSLDGCIFTGKKIILVLGSVDFALTIFIINFE
jgi:hypothetical protein